MMPPLNRREVLAATASHWSWSRAGARRRGQGRAAVAAGRGQSTARGCAGSVALLHAGGRRDRGGVRQQRSRGWRRACDKDTTRTRWAGRPIHRPIPPITAAARASGNGGPTFRWNPD